MTILFINEASSVFYDNKGNPYVAGGMSNAVLGRYANLCDELIVLCRKEEIVYDDNTIQNQQQKLQYSNVKFLEYVRRTNSICRFLNPKYIIKNRFTLINAIYHSDKIIIRTNTINPLIFIPLIKVLKKEYLVESVGCTFDALWNYSFLGKILAPISYMKQRILVKYANSVLYVTNKFLQERYPTKGKQISVSDVVLENVNIDVETKRKLRIDSLSSIITLGTCGAIDVPYKGHTVVIDAISKLKIYYPNITYKYVLVGGGDSTRLREYAINAGVLDCITFLGTVPHNKVFEMLDIFDLYVQPSLVEGMPRSLIEAMSRGLPCFATNVGGIPELLPKSCLFNKGDSKRLTILLSSISKELLYDLSNQNFSYVKSNFSDDNERVRQGFYKDFCSSD